ncbi:MAG: hypothetical protein F9K40_00020 [Kofleriaceae bacterium]|nr:MAG: hypothetical protein F9K40_00020 [Kofleriaceae bacterium]
MLGTMDGAAKFAVVDVETTGFRRNHDRIVEVAVITAGADGKVVEEYVTLVNPERDIGPTHVHGIRASRVNAAPRFAEIAGDLCARLKGAVLVAHNATFDVGFLRGEFSRLGSELPAIPSVCTLKLSRLLKLPLASRRLSACCEHAGIELRDPHAALGDARAVAGLLRYYLELAAKSEHVTAAHLGGSERPAPDDAWPSFARPGPVCRRVESPPRPADATYVDRLLERLEPGSDHDEGMAAYFDVLDRALADRTLTPEESDDLFEVARDWGLRREDVKSAHVHYLRALTEAAYADGVLSTDEEKDLQRVAAILGCEGALPSVRAEVAHARAVAVDAVSTKPTARSGSKTVCFTGALTSRLRGARITRASAQAMAREAGYTVLDSVTRDLDILVVADADSMSSKAKKARACGTRIVPELEFWQMLGVTVESGPGA